MQTSVLEIRDVSPVAAAHADLARFYTQNRNTVKQTAVFVCLAVLMQDMEYISVHAAMFYLTPGMEIYPVSDPTENRPICGLYLLSRDLHYSTDD